MFVRCLETYLKKLISLGHEETLPGPFIPWVPRNLPRWVYVGVHLGVHEGPGGSPEPWYSWTMTK